MQLFGAFWAQLHVGWLCDLSWRQWRPSQVVSSQRCLFWVHMQLPDALPPALPTLLAQTLDTQLGYFCSGIAPEQPGQGQVKVGSYTSPDRCAACPMTILDPPMRPIHPSVRCRREHLSPSCPFYWLARTIIPNQSPAAHSALCCRR